MRHHHGVHDSQEEEEEEEEEEEVWGGKERRAGSAAPGLRVEPGHRRLGLIGRRRVLGSGRMEGPFFKMDRK